MGKNKEQGDTKCSVHLGLTGSWCDKQFWRNVSENFACDWWAGISYLIRWLPSLVSKFLCTNTFRQERGHCSWWLTTDGNKQVILSSCLTDNYAPDQGLVPGVKSGWLSVIKSWLKRVHDHSCLRVHVQDLAFQKNMLFCKLFLFFLFIFYCSLCFSALPSVYSCALTAL